MHKTKPRFGLLRPGWPHACEDLLLGKPDHLRAGVLSNLGTMNCATCKYDAQRHDYYAVTHAPFSPPSLVYYSATFRRREAILIDGKIPRVGRKIRPNIGPASAADGTNEPALDVAQSHIIRPAIGVRPCLFPREQRGRRFLSTLLIMPIMVTGAATGELIWNARI
jgi:hypothetical protein